MTDASGKSTFVYVTFIRTTPERLWSALTSAEFQEQYWFGVHCESEWKVGSPWRLVFSDGRVADTGEIVEADPPRRLVIKWRNEFRPELKAEGYTRCTFQIDRIVDGEVCQTSMQRFDAGSDAVKLTITHEIDRPGSKMIDAVSNGWPRILSNLKSLLETGEIVLTPPRAAG